MSFRKRVYGTAERVPSGKVISYSGLAGLAGSLGAARAVGTLMAKNPYPGTSPGRVPCHRVVRSDGSPGGFTGPGGPARKRDLLEKEGIEFICGKIPKRFFVRS